MNVLNIDHLLNSPVRHGVSVCRSPHEATRPQMADFLFDRMEIESYFNLMLQLKIRDFIF